MASDGDDRTLDRRKLLTDGARALGLLFTAGTAGAVVAGAREDTVWQLDPDKCIQCGNCATACVLTPSAVKCVHDVSLCGYCDLCFGYFAERRPGDEETAENVRCPTDAIIRNFVEDPYYEYLIDEPRCIGCGICVEGCGQYGNGSLILQVRHDRCKNCNECAIAVQCPAQAFVRVPRSKPYILRSERLKEQEELEQELGGGAPQGPTRPAQPGAQPAQGVAPRAQGIPESGPLEVPREPTQNPGAAPPSPLPVDDLSGGGLQPPPSGASTPPPSAPTNAPVNDADNLRTLLGVDSL